MGELRQVNTLPRPTRPRWVPAPGPAPGPRTLPRHRVKAQPHTRGHLSNHRGTSTAPLTALKIRHGVKNAAHATSPSRNHT